ncbi:glycosyltransferase [Chryseobacterium sp. SNU WT5]|uniref:glycosyltransferase n=1 Tax=Chryseobacterium sp. SNU WT5 TaxID=2594269 RepID=UPI0016240885|nr:glycosyltransferase [Chryseobacterium sp. SNU WT5]
MTEKLLSIVVPTKNRYFYLKYLVTYFNQIKDLGIELIIQDNSDELEDQPDFKNFLENLDDPRIIYSFIEEGLSVIDNSDEALLKASGEYVTFIGDDDIFSHHLISFLKEAKAKNISAILPEKSSYSWPDITSRFYGNKLSGKFTQTKISGEKKIISTSEELDKVLELGGTEILELPRVYHGIVKRSILQQIYEDTGSYFPGPSPDMANAVAICNYLDKLLVIDIPLVISGHSKKSGGGLGVSGKHLGEISDFKHLPKETAGNWTKEVPMYWSGYTIYAESAIQALKRLNLADKLLKLNYNFLYATCLVFDTHYKERIIKTINSSVEKKIGVSKIKINFLYIKVWLKRISYHLKSNMRYIFKDGTNGSVFEKGDIYDVAILNDQMIENYLNSNMTFL